MNNEFIFELDDLRLALCQAYRMDENKLLEQLIPAAKFTPEQTQQINELGRKLVVAVRKKRVGRGGLDAFLAEYDLSSDEGIALMCLAEALLRIPDNETIDRLIADKIADPDWQKHLGKDKSTFINASTWALMLTGKILRHEETEKLTATVKKLAQRSGTPVIRTAVKQAMKILGRQFVMGQTIDEALSRAVEQEAKGYTYSFDMLGEEACTAQDATKYYASYLAAIEKIGKANNKKGIYAGAGISIKLSALHPRYEWRKRERVLAELTPKVQALALRAKELALGFTIDAEEAERLDISLDIFAVLAADPQLAGWNGLGLAVQAYQKRAIFVLDFVFALAKQNKRRIMVRLVKGAYWDAEIKMAQERGMSGYPVFTRKDSTDVCYLACVKKMLAATDMIYPQFATHNAHTVATILTLTGDYRDFEFQCLHGMGDTLYDNVVGNKNLNIPCRIYAPVGGHEHLLAYLVRRLLENGANTSFVNRIIDERAPIEELLTDPASKIVDLTDKKHAKIPLPVNLYGAQRPNSVGVDFTNPLEYQKVLTRMQNFVLPSALPNANSSQIAAALSNAELGAKAWGKIPVDFRVECIQNLAQLLVQHQAELMALLVREGGKTINDAMAEVREAIDFCWYYALRTKLDFNVEVLRGPTGQHDQITLASRGIVACISPWNFPLAIFLGQVSAALLAGNAVIAKPAGQTPRIAAYTVALLHEAGVPENVVQVLVGSGSTVGEALINDLRINGVIFTGSTQTAWHINRALANRNGAIVPFIAETGGQNAMIVDSSALLEQVVKDVMTSAFGSAGQRCSCLRVLYLQDSIADRLIAMLCGAMAELKLGDPMELSTDIGPMIDQIAVKAMLTHREKMRASAKTLFEVALPNNLPHQNFFGPCAFEIKNIAELEGEVFGPILHVIRYNSADLAQIIDDINNTGYGLTLGIHSRIDDTVDFIIQRAKVGNIYVNRNMIGAVVGVQPFGGEGLSGTGPKAGGPRYVQRLATERVVSINTAAAGGNATLLSLD